MLDGVGDVPLADEARADVLSQRQLRMEQLQREFFAVSVRRRVDRGHPTDAEDSIEAVLSAQHSSDAPLRAYDHILVVRCRHSVSLCPTRAAPLSQPHAILPDPAILRPFAGK